MSSLNPVHTDFLNIDRTNIPAHPISPVSPPMQHSLYPLSPAGQDVILHQHPNRWPFEPSPRNIPAATLQPNVPMSSHPYSPPVTAGYSPHTLHHPPRSHPQPPPPPPPPSSFPPWTLAGSLDPSTGIFYRTPENPRLRTAQACEKCRTRKAKCSGEHPTCNRCLTRGLICEYAKEGRMRGPNRPKAKDSGSSSIDDDSTLKTAAGHKRIASAPLHHHHQQQQHHHHHHRSPTTTTRLHPDSSSSEIAPSQQHVVERDDTGKRRSLPLFTPSLSRPTGDHSSPPSSIRQRRDHVSGRARPPSLILEKSSPRHTTNVHSHQVKPIPGLNATIKFQQDEMSPVNSMQPPFVTYPENPHPHGGGGNGGTDYQVAGVGLGGQVSDGNSSFRDDEVPVYYPYVAAFGQQMNGHVDLMPPMYDNRGGTVSYPHSEASTSHDSSPTNATHSPTTPASQTTFYRETDEAVVYHRHHHHPHENAYGPHEGKGWGMHLDAQINGDPFARSPSTIERTGWGNLVDGGGDYVRADESERLQLVDAGYPIELRL